MTFFRGLAASLNGHHRYVYKRPEIAVDYLVVGGGVVGLAVARRLVQQFPSKSVYLVERHDTCGQETSSRNSEVIHGGFYYPANSLKTRLCIQGRQMLYDYCRSRSVPFKQTGKLVVGHASQMPYLKSLLQKSTTEITGVPLSLLSGLEARELEPDLSPDIAGALFSPSTGIIDSHSLMNMFEEDITDGGGNIACGTEVVRVDAYQPADREDTAQGWVVQTVTRQGGGDALGLNSETDSILAHTIVNASGLSSHLILNSLRGDSDTKPTAMYYARGCYASYSGPGISQVSHLIYPVPTMQKVDGASRHSFAGLGTHLTLDLNGRIKFGPNIEWLQPHATASGPEAHSEDPDHIDYWTAHLNPDDESALLEMQHSIVSYLPHVDPAKLKLDYCGIRPKLGPPGSGFEDFRITKHFARVLGGTMNNDGLMVTLAGIESPGLTSSMAIGELVVDEMLSGV